MPSAYTEHAKRKTVSAMGVTYALRGRATPCTASQVKPDPESEIKEPHASSNESRPVQSNRLYYLHF